MAVPLHAADMNGTATTVVVQPLSLVNTSDLDFGTILPGTTGGRVTVDEDTGARSVTGGPTLAGTRGGAAHFIGYGGPRMIMQIRVGPAPTLTRIGGGATMDVRRLRREGPAVRVLRDEGLVEFNVGGQLDVGANQMPGVYEGEFTVTVTYF